MLGEVFDKILENHTQFWLILALIVLIHVNEIFNSVFNFMRRLSHIGWFNG